MKKILAALLSLVATACYATTAPVGYCANNVAQTISNGYIAPVPFASITLCTAGSTSSNCAANIVSVYTTPALTTPTPTNPVVADTGGNYYFCAAAGHYALLISGSVGGFFIPDMTFSDDWSKGGVVTGTWQATLFIGPLTGNATTASASDHSPAQCGAGNYATGVSTVWAANCSPIYYQTLKFNSVAATQQPIANFTQRFSFANSSGFTNVDLNAPGTGNIVPTETTDPGASTNCATYDGNKNIAPTSSSCGTTSATQTTMTGSRAFSTIYQNTTGKTMVVSGYGITPGGSGTSRTACFDGLTSPPTIPLGACGQSNATEAGQHTAFEFVVPNLYYYEVTFAGTDATGGLGSWVEQTF